MKYSWSDFIFLLKISFKAMKYVPYGLWTELLHNIRAIHYRRALHLVSNLRGKMPLLQPSSHTNRRYGGRLHNRLTFIRLTIEFDNLLFRRFSWIRQLAHIFLRIFSHHSKVFRFNAGLLRSFGIPTCLPKRWIALIALSAASSVDRPATFSPLLQRYPWTDLSCQLN